MTKLVCNWMDIVVCEICGNEVATQSPLCPFCNTKLSVDSQLPRGPKHKVVNLKKGMPLVKQALDKMKRELDFAGKQHCLIVTLIHGYGASGKGGAIRDEARRQLYYMLELGQIKEVAEGEKMGKHSTQRRQLFKRFPFLDQSGEYKGANPGITLVVL